MDIHGVKRNTAFVRGLNEGVPVFQLIRRPRQSGAHHHHGLLEGKLAELLDQRCQGINLAQSCLHGDTHVSARAQRILRRRPVGIALGGATAPDDGRPIHSVQRSRAKRQSIQHGDGALGEGG